MDEAGVDNATRAEVPVWAVEALVTNTVDILVTSIADSVVSRVSARSKQGLSNGLKGGIFDCRSEAVLWVVAVFVFNEAGNAEIKVLASSAGNEALLWEFCG